MSNSETKEIQVKTKAGTPASAEPTREGLSFVPSVDIFETESAITLIVDMPGVAAEGLDINLDDRVLVLAGEVTIAGEAGETEVYTEYRTGGYYRRFTLSEVIDREKIDAVLKNGVLRLTLPKVAKAVPRKIPVQAG